MINHDFARREADVKVVNELSQLKDSDKQMKVVRQLEQFKDTYFQTDIW